MDKLPTKRGAATVATPKQTKQVASQIAAAETSGAGCLLPEYLRIGQAVRIFSIGRSTLYTLIASGSVTSRVVKTSRHNVSGIRLIATDSLRAFIESCSQEAVIEKSK